MAKIAIVRIRTAPTSSTKEESTLTLLRLHKKFYCSVHESSPHVLGMLNRVRHFITWGEIDDATEKELQKRAKKEKKFFRLHPPRGGFERKGIKIPFTLGGAYGNRGKKINDLLKRMV